MSGATEALRCFVRNRAGINLDADKDYLVVSRLEPRLRSWQVPSLAALAEHLRTQPTSPLADGVIAALTTNETLWFRDGKPFDAMRQAILPDLFQRSGADRSLRIWSAACSTGQEVYSLAILLDEEGVRAKNCRVSILGTDISEPAVERAKAAIYTQFEVQRGLSAKRLVQYFEQAGSDWRVRGELRTGIEFRLLNLLDVPRDLGLFDVVFCRNVLIYFEADLKRSVLASIASRMRPGAYLALGGAETTLGLTSSFAPLPGWTGMYRKLG